MMELRLPEFILIMIYFEVDDHYFPMMITSDLLSTGEIIFLVKRPTSYRGEIDHHHLLHVHYINLVNNINGYGVYNRYINVVKLYWSNLQVNPQIRRSRVSLHFTSS